MAKNFPTDWSILDRIVWKKNNPLCTVSFSHIERVSRSTIWRRFLVLYWGGDASGLSVLGGRSGTRRSGAVVIIVIHAWVRLCTWRDSGSLQDAEASFVLLSLASAQSHTADTVSRFLPQQRNATVKKNNLLCIYRRSPTPHHRSKHRAFFLLPPSSPS